LTDREKLLKNLNEIGVKFPSRQRFTLTLQDGELGILTIENKSKIKLENEKLFNNQSFLFSGAPTALLDIVDCQCAEEYVDKLLDLRKRWGLNKSREEAE